MGILNKVKNIFFEEEIVEIEEKPKKEKKEKKEAPVAKKIELPKTEKKESKEIKQDILEKREDKVVEKPVEKNDNKFPMDFDEDDFKTEKRDHFEEEFSEINSRRSERHKNSVKMQEKPKEEEKIDIYEEEVVQEKPQEPKYDFELEYGLDNEHEKHGLYEGKTTKKAFTPTPIISPIYGILDKNYKKEDVVTKKEIILSSASKKIDLDSVREKAYGDLTSDISQSIEDSEYEDDSNEDTMYDLNEENSSPAVKEVTVGDAEEYFNELGLEYNIDYKDTSVEKQKNSKDKKRRTKIEETKSEIDENVEDKNDESVEDDGLESNLFDLIESMYDEKE